MMFTLTGQVCGQHHTTSAESDGFGITIHTSEGPVRARHVADAIRIAHRDMGLYLQAAERAGRPWGLYVSVAGVQAVYGAWPLLSGASSDEQHRPSDVARIRRRWHDSGPLSALANALEIVRHYLTRSRDAA